MKHIFSVGAVVAGCMLVFGCTTNALFSTKQRELIAQHSTVVEQLSDTKRQKLLVFSQQQKIGTQVADNPWSRVANALFVSDGGNNTRSRVTKGTRVKKVTTLTPVHVLQETLRLHFASVGADNPNNANSLVITTKPVAYNLYNRSTTESKDAFILEYASDIIMELASAGLKRFMRCDDTSTEALSKEEWFADHHSRIIQFAVDAANKCSGKIFSELGMQ